ncbi:MAG: NADH-quinone oxidoreductase subunit L [Alphaproteobacteria bacterium]|nr:NADH-quinone oxidoreductase subunit L [Alphaproteobacteria bacterium]
MISAIVFLPLLGAIGAGIASLMKNDTLGYVFSLTGVLLSAMLGWVVFITMAIPGIDQTVFLASWISVGSFQVDWALRFDTLTAVMVIVVTTVSAMVHVYSVGYMSHDKSKPRFMAYLGLFTFAMLMLVTADNLVQLFFGWEGVGVASYLLIGFWYQRPSAHQAAMKAFVVNRVGDFGFALGIFALFHLTGSVQLDVIFQSVPDLVNSQITILGYAMPALEVAGILLFIGAMGKSAQLGLHTWLPDAMEGPTPVSALIHAATMVTAGVFLVCRLSPMLEYAPFTRDVITVVGALTAIFAATIGLTQFDIKRVIAYSTCSQLGYMFFAAGVSAYPAAMFHLTTHAFFKALLFLGAGSVIHAMSDEQDMRNMGGIWHKIPFTYAMMWIGSLALAGIPFFAGYYSKDMILEAAYAAHTPIGNFAWVMGIAAAFLTAFYSWRLLMMTFHGKPRASAEVMSHIHESPLVMTIPLFILAIGAVLSGWMFYELFVGHHWYDFWRQSIFIDPANNIMDDAHHVPKWVKLLPLFISLAGIGLAIIIYGMMPSVAGGIARLFRPIHQLFYRKWYFDEIYDAVFVRPAVEIGRVLWIRGDKDTIDGFGPDGISNTVNRFSAFCSRMQSGYVFHYAFAMLIGVIALLAWYIRSL